MFNNKKIKELELQITKLEGKVEALQKQEQYMYERFKASCQRYIDKKINKLPQQEGRGR